MIGLNKSNSSEEIRYDTLISCGKAIDQIIEREQFQPDLAEILQGSTSVTYVQPLTGSDEEFLKTHSVNLPPSIRGQLDYLEVRTFMGLFPEINRAWMSIDNRLFIWNYKDGNDVYEYNDQDQVICTVGLVKPKTDVFSDAVDYLLIVATPLQIIPLALSINKKESYSAQGITLYATDLTIPADEILMAQITGTKDGRIFMIGNDGHLYELEYRNPDIWFSRKCQLICRSDNLFNKYIPTMLRTTVKPNITSIAIDDERKVLYLLTNQSTIEVIYLGDSYDNYKSIYKYTNIIDNALQMSRQHMRTYEREHFRVESIHVISKRESKKLHLVAVTSSGFRLYFTHHKDALRTTLPYDKIPDTLELGHIRFPSPSIDYAAGETRYRFRYSYYDCGVSISVRGKTEDTDSIMVTSPSIAKVKSVEDTTRSAMSMNIGRPTLVETLAVVESDCKIWTIQEANKEMTGMHTLKDIAELPSTPPRQFLALTGTSLIFYNKQRPVDVLQRMITRLPQPNRNKHSEYMSFFERYGKSEACALCLSIACSAESQDTVKEATRLFFEFGGAPSSAPDVPRANDTNINPIGRVSGQVGVIYSGKHDGFLLYFGRLVSPIWNSKIFANIKNNEAMNNTLFAKLQKSLLEARHNLVNLKQFMDANPSFHYSATISDPRFQTSDQSVLLLELAEQKSVHELYLLLIQCIEAISFIDFLTDTGIEEIIKQIHDKYADHINAFDLNKMLTTLAGRDTTRELVLSAIYKYGSIHSHAEYNVVSELLKRTCGSFFNKNDFAFFKGSENISRAYKSESRYEKSAALKESLAFFKETADDITEDKMGAIVSDYMTCSFHVGIIELGLERANKLDPQQLGLVAYETKSDKDGFNHLYYQKRLRAYEYIFSALKDVCNLKTQSVPPNRAPIEDKDIYISNVFSTALATRDKLFHFQLYQWYIKENMTNELLSIDTVYLIPFFQNHVTNPLCSLDFLWQYYRRREQFYDAARYLEKIAFLRTHNLPLGKRMEYLAYAHVNARCRDPKNQSVQESTEFIQTLDEYINTARQQVRVQTILRSRENPEAKTAADLLDLELLSAEKLQQFRNTYNV
ncbi:Nup133 N terminal like-domain-containing protein [Pilobolus umbonatus]|nr:Nup133 N terminal like-domain-containing protein [Pilobolus umbonatus]